MQMNLLNRRTSLTTRVLAAALMAAVVPSRAATYFVSISAGDDARSPARAQTLDQPWKTLQRAADLMQPGDVCLVAGGTYRESVRLKSDGVTFLAAKGEVPVVSGCEMVSGWNRHANRIFKASVATKVLAVFENIVHMNLARHPDTSEDPFSTADWMTSTAETLSSSGTGTARITFDSASWPPDHWRGGHYVGVHGNNYFQANRGNITGSDARSITIRDLNLRFRQGLKEFTGAGRGYIMDHLNALTSPREWHWKEGTLYFQPSDDRGIEGKQIEARTRLYGFDLSGRQRVKIAGFRFVAASILIDGGNHNTIDGCAFLYASPWGKHYETQLGDFAPYAHGSKEDGTAGLYIHGSGNVVRNSYLAHLFGQGVHLRGGRSNVVENCLFEDFNWLALQDGAAVLVNGDDQVVRRCTIRRTAAMGLSVKQIGEVLVKRPVITHNHIEEVGRILIDGGQSAIYVNNHNAPSDARSLDWGEIAYNFIGRVHLPFDNDKGMGIYIDDGTDFLRIHHNVVRAGACINWPIFLHGNRHHQESIHVYHNTIWDYDNAGNTAGIVSSVWGQGRRTDIRVINNLTQHRAFRALGVPGGVTEETNLGNVTAAFFVDVTANDFRLRPGTAAVDAGTVIPGINDGFQGAAPDLGAYELGAAPWKAGSTLTGDPTKR